MSDEYTQSSNKYQELEMLIDGLVDWMEKHGTIKPITRESMIRRTESLSS